MLGSLRCIRSIVPCCLLGSHKDTDGARNLQPADNNLNNSESLLRLALRRPHPDGIIVRRIESNDSESRRLQLRLHVKGKLIKQI